MGKKTILVDLDGVLNEYTGTYKKNNIPKPKKDVEKFLKNLNKDYEVVVFTTRNLLETSRWLIRNKLDKFINDVSNIKKAAYLCIDDRAIQFEGDFSDTLEKIKNFAPHWKNK